MLERIELVENLSFESGHVFSLLAVAMVRFEEIGEEAREPFVDRNCMFGHHLSPLKHANGINPP